MTDKSFQKEHMFKTISKIALSLNSNLALFNNNMSLDSGRTGAALFHFYYGLFLEDSQYLDSAREIFTAGMAAFDIKQFVKVYSSDSLDNHLAGIGRFVEFCNKHKLLEINVNSYLEQLDNALAGLMRSKITIGDFDYNSGAVASGYYFLSRLSSNDKVKVNLSELVHGIADKAIQDDEGHWYWESPTLYRNTYFGISHGSAMIISIVGSLAEKGIETALCLEILEKSVPFVLKHKRQVKYGHFPISNGDESFDEKPFCICYGDLSVALSLVKARRFIKNDDLDDIIHKILKESYERKPGIYPRDASITYGAAGLAEMFNALFDLTDDQECRKAAGYWYQEIPRFASYENDFAGFYSMTTKEKDFWNLSFGWGVAGIGITLMRYLKPELPAFNELLMIA
ncbi:lanthionine synthetase LanC family protein [Mucilaginibacter sp. CAU 1740]|uniref:lanthionine synthetase LanC family protein n=1 Tax=Mucilaginibacter sp. CAU 1740 TaxID=3140365 RepID=UPI00325ADBDB